ncbi:MAG: hypothetical protein RSC76_06710 [Oscillospiraceae bacterium]
MAKYCTNCGKELPENGQCPCQKAAVQPPDPQKTDVHLPPLQTSPVSAPPPQPYIPASYAPPPLRETPATALLRKWGTSPLMLVLCVLFSLAAITGLITEIIAAGSQSALGNIHLQNKVAVPAGTQSIALNISTVIIGSVGGLLIAAGMWMFYFACKNQSQPVIKTTGISIIKVVYMIFSILAIVVLFFAGIALLILPGIMGGYMGLLEEYMEPAAAQIVSSLFSFFGICCFFFALFLVIYLVFVVKTINAVLLTARTGMANGKISMFVIVMNWIVALSSFLLVFASGIDFLPPLLSCGGYAVLSLLLVKYRKPMQQIVCDERRMNPPQNPS